MYASGFFVQKGRGVGGGGGGRKSFFVVGSVKIATFDLATCVAQFVTAFLRQLSLERRICL